MTHYPKKGRLVSSNEKKVNLSEKTRPAGRPMETIVLSDDEEDAAPRTGLCIHCGQVSKPHACPHGTVKIMKPLSKSKCHPAKKQRTSAAAADGGVFPFIIRTQFAV